MMKLFNILFPLAVALFTLISVLISNYLKNKAHSLDKFNKLLSDDKSLGIDDKNYINEILYELKYRCGNREYEYLYNKLCKDEPQWNRIISFLIKTKIISIHYFNEYKKVSIFNVDSEEFRDNNKVKFLDKNEMLRDLNLKKEEYAN